MSIADLRWEEGISHFPESEKLIRLISGLDLDDSLNLKMGGDGDMGETLAYFLDELIETGRIYIEVVEQ